MSLDEEWEQSGLVGKMAAGRYLIVSELTADNRRTLYEAEHVELGVRVTLGVVRADGTPTEQRLQNGQKLRSLKQPGLVSILDVGKLDSGDLYVATERPDGTTLRALAAGNRLDQRRALLIIRQVLEALAGAHAVGAIHGDIKPEHVLITPGLGEQRVKLTDFGVAALTGATRAGDPVYSAPESALGAIDARADIYSTGAVLFELLTGHPPFFADDPTAMRRLHAYAPMQTLKQRAPDESFPDALEMIVATALAKKRDARYQSASDMIAALDPVLQAVEEAGEPPPPMAPERRRKPNDSLLLLAKDLMPQTPATGPAALEPVVPANVAREVPELPWRTRMGRLARRAYERMRATAVMLVTGVRALDRRLGVSAWLRRLGDKAIDKLGLRGRVDKLSRAQKRILAAIGVVFAFAVLALVTCGGSGSRPPSIEQQAAASIARGNEELAAGHDPAALTAFDKAIRLTPKLAMDPEVIDSLGRIAGSTDTATAVAGLELIALHSGADGFATIASHASMNPHAEVRHRAIALAEQVGAAEQVDRVTSWSLDLDQATTCEARRQVIAKLGKTGDRRALPALQRAKTNRCVERDAAMAIQRINAPRAKRR